MPVSNEVEAELAESYFRDKTYIAYEMLFRSRTRRLMPKLHLLPVRSGGSQAAFHQHGRPS